MGQSYSVDLRSRVIEAVAQGLSRRQAADRFGVGISSAIRWVQRHRATGSVKPGSRGGDMRSGRIEAHADFILSLVAETPDITLVELQEKLKARGVSAGTSTLWRFFDRHGLTWKKRRRMPVNRTGPTY